MSLAYFEVLFFWLPCIPEPDQKILMYTAPHYKYRILTPLAYLDPLKTAGPYEDHYTQIVVLIVSFTLRENERYIQQCAYVFYVAMCESLSVTY